MPRKHYQHDEAVYRQLQHEGKTSWDEQSDPSANFENFVLRPFVEQTLALSGPDRQGRRALEVGCGTGPVSCFLAAHGFTVDGIDISASAIAMAHRHADMRQLQVRFVVADICNMPPGFGPYDLIVDGHCLHCLAHNASRQRALAAIRLLLKDAGVFIVEMMVWHDKLRIGQRYRIDDDGMLWLRIDDAQDYDEAARFSGQWYLPHRRILQPAQVLEELRQTGFDPVHHEVVPQIDQSKPHLLRVRCVPVTT